MAIFHERRRPLDRSTAPALRILLIDDNRADNFLHSRTLRQALPDCEITVATSALLGLDQLGALDPGHSGGYDLILLDVNMPELDAWGFLDRYRLLPADVRARRLAIMAGAELTRPFAARAASDPLVDDVVDKPLTAESVAGLGALVLRD